MLYSSCVGLDTQFVMRNAQTDNAILPATMVAHELNDVDCF